MEEFHRLTDARLTADLRAGLADAVVVAGELDDAPSLADVVADRLFDIYVLAGLDGPDRGQCVPVVRRGDAHRVNRRIVHDPPQILHDARLDPLRHLRRLHGPAD